MSLTQEDLNQHWHLDKRIPLALIMTILLQTAGGVWWAATLTERVTIMERTMAYNAPQSDRLTRVEVKIDTINDSLVEIKASLRKAN